MITNDPVADYLRYDAEQQEKLNKLPKCYYCENPIQDDFCYKINDEFFCEQCLNDEFRVQTDLYME